MVKLSVIIPIYNAEKYLRQCLDSLLSQTLKNIEIICVNDGSSDGSESIIRKYVKQDERVILLNQENQGEYAARKNGYRISSGEFIALVDADDWLEPDVYATVIADMERNGADVGIFNYYTNSETKQEKAAGYTEQEIIEDRQRIKQLSFAGLVGRENPIAAGRYEGWPWNKIYRRRIYEIQEREGTLFKDWVRHFGDALFNIRMMQNCRKLAIYTIYGYHYRIGNTESITGRYYAKLPPKKDFMLYQKFGEELWGGDFLWPEVLNTMYVNLFWSYIYKHHYFHPQNKQSLRDQFQEINGLLYGKSREGIYFPLKEALKGCRPEWVNNRIFRILVKYHLLTAATLYIDVKFSRWKNK